MPILQIRVWLLIFWFSFSGRNLSLHSFFWLLRKNDIVFSTDFIICLSLRFNGHSPGEPGLACVY